MHPPQPVQSLFAISAIKFDGATAIAAGILSCVIARNPAQQQPQQLHMNIAPS
jgi:hypothetical protein